MDREILDTSLQFRSTKMQLKARLTGCSAFSDMFDDLIHTAKRSNF